MIIKKIFKKKKKKKNSYICLYKSEFIVIYI